jgi:mRNA-degrading endonuclease toxin of MazEF toxin-antitoxin module
MKDFDRWNALKKQLDAHHAPPHFNEREIWWCSVGVNVGYEVYGKGKLFTRPVLIFKKQSKATFFGIPMSTKIKPRGDYYVLEFGGRYVAMMLGELRRFDSRRLADKMGKLSEERFEEVRKAVLKNFQPRTV